MNLFIIFNHYRTTLFLTVILFFLLPISFVQAQNETMYIMNGGFIEEEFNVATDIDSVIFYDPADAPDRRNYRFLDILKNGEEVVMKSFLDGEVDSILFHEPVFTAADLQNMLKSIYWAMNDAQRLAGQSYFFVNEIASDDRLGGGGANDVRVMSQESLVVPYDDHDMLYHNWDRLYNGIYRINTVFSMMDSVDDFENEVQKNQFKGELYFLRAFFLFQLTSLHGEIPLPLTNEFVPSSAASIQEIYGQIASDLQKAIEIMPEHAYSMLENGQASRWAAQALMARVYLFYTGFYNTTTLPLIQGGSVSKNQVITWLSDCINNSGHQLVDDFHELWAYTNAYTIDDYGYIQDYMSQTGKSLQYASDFDNRNPESVFALTFSTEADWGVDRGHSNQYMLYFSLRGLQDINNTFPFAGGWGQGQSVSPAMVEDWIADEPNDPRLWASVLNIQQEVPDYQRGLWDFMMETDYAQKKYIGITAEDPSTGNLVNDYSVLMYNNQNSNQLSHMTDLILIRYADVLLMMSELTEDAQWMNQVRARAGLDPASYSLENLQKERRYELAFEGLRWNDIRRWGIAAQALEQQEGVPVYNFGEPEVHSAYSTAGYTGRYEATQGFFPIPQSAIDQSEGLLEQVPGWDTADSQFTGWGN